MQQKWLVFEGWSGFFVSKYQRVVVLLVVLFCGAQGWARIEPDKLAETPVSSWYRVTSDSTAIEFVNPTPAVPRKAVSPRVVDRTFLLLYSVDAALTVTDIELTQHSLSAGSVYESNIVYGLRPTRGRMYGINMPLLWAEMAISGWIKHKRPTSVLWMLAPVTGSFSHGIGIVSGFVK